jgi:hypothetical protein
MTIGITTLSSMTVGRMTLSIMTLRFSTLIIMPLNIMFILVSAFWQLIEQHSAKQNEDCSADKVM